MNTPLDSCHQKHSTAGKTLRLANRVNIIAIAVRGDACRRFASRNGCAERHEISPAFSHRFRQM